MLSSAGYWIFSHPEICSGDQSRISLLATTFRSFTCLARRQRLGRRADSQAWWSASWARYSGRPPWRATSRLTVDVARSRPLAISRIDEPEASPREMSKSYRPPADSGTLALFAPCVYDPVQKEELLLDPLRHFQEEVTRYRERIFKEACERNPENLTLNRERVVKEFLDANPTRRASVEVFQAAVTDTRVDCLRIAPLLKNSAFVEENEWRLVLPILLDCPTMLNNPPQFRVGKTTLIPYIAHPFPVAAPLPIVDIILGPGSDENSVFAAQRFLKSHGLDLTPRLSKVPYRAS